MSLLAVLFIAHAAAEFLPFQEGKLIIGQRTGVEGTVGEAEDVALDLKHWKAYVADPSAGRILRFALDTSGTPVPNAEAVLGKTDFAQPNTSGIVDASSLFQPVAVCVDTSGRLWVADAFQHRVLRFDRPWEALNGHSADAVLGQPSFTSADFGKDAGQFYEPRGLAMDPRGNLYVSDSLNNRILRFNKAAEKANGAAADAVFGQSGFGQSVPGTSASKLRTPTGISITSFTILGSEPAVWLWVADTGNNRVLRFGSANTVANGAAADKVLGQPDFSSNTTPSAANSTRLRSPKRVLAQLNGVWVADSGHHRVVRFENTVGIANGTAAEGVLGQGGFSGRLSGNGAGKLHTPGGLAMGPNFCLWVCDSGNRRVVWHHNAPAKTNGADANGLLGADSLVIDPAQVLNPGGLAVDPATGKLFVSDIYRHRVLRFADHRALSEGASPEAVFGQSNFSDSDPSLAAQGMNTPHGIWVDNGGRLWVADTGNNRVLRFDQAATRPSGVSADQLLGQPAYGEGEPSLSAYGMNSPGAVVVDTAGRLWVSDALNHRVLRFDNAAAKPSNASADGVLGQANFTSDQSTTVTASRMNTPIGLHLENNGRLWVVDCGNSRVLRFESAPLKANGAPADGVLGQANFTSRISSASATGLEGPVAAWMDKQNRLWVADRNNYRLVRYDNAAKKPNGAPGDFLFGQEAWGLSDYGDLSTRICPTSLFFDQQGALWLADFYDFDIPAGRVLRYTELAALNVRCGINAQGRFFLTFSSEPQTTYNIEQSSDLINWASVDYVDSTGTETTWVHPTPPSGAVFFRVYPTSTL